jgi:hypothetical protein
MVATEDNEERHDQECETIKTLAGDATNGARVEKVWIMHHA